MGSAPATSPLVMAEKNFALVFPDCSASDAAKVLNGVRAQLDAAITVGGLPKFTVSFGVTETEVNEDFDAALRRADEALLHAKAGGRDRVVLHDAMGERTTTSSGDRSVRKTRNEGTLLAVE